MMTTRRLPPHRRANGFSLIEIMVGIVIGLIAMLVIYQVFAAAEGIKRNTTSVGDAQQNGLLSSFMLGIELANAGNAVASAAQDLGTCPAGAANFASSWRPIPLMIYDSGSDALPDSFAVNYSVANSAIAPAPFTATSAANADYSVQSPTGFKVNDLIVAISSAGCGVSRVTGVSVPDGLGVITVTHTDPGIAATYGTGNSLFNIGPSAGSQKVFYDVTPMTPSPGGVLRSTALLTADGAPALGAIAPNPIASNIVNMKLQYGLDTNNDGKLEWVNASTANWTPNDLLTMPGPNLVAQLKALRAVRIGLVVQGEQFDRNFLQDVPWHLFGGTLLGGYEGNFPASGGNYRYRTYETVIPLRNEVWNRS